ncbi:MAG TPA: enoyl-ACP reductase [Dehalococcoidia bacterium]
MLEGKRALVMGVANNRSLAWGITRALAGAGAQVALSYATERFKKNVQELAAELGPPDAVPLIECDVTSDESVERLFRELGERWGALDILVHSIAYAEREDLLGRVTDISRHGFATALDVSAYSLLACARGARPLMEAAGGGSVITLTFMASEKVFPGYNVMAFAKAALECEVRYLAEELGPANIRVNAISAGAVRTLAASAVKGVSELRRVTEERAPLRRATTQEDVGGAALFLASPLASGVTGQILYVDSGFHILAGVEMPER